MKFKGLYENESLENKVNNIFSNNEKFIDIIKKNNCYEYHYFLSHLRHDLFNWYPFKEDGALLEIGSSYGQLTELFTKKVNHVVCIEDSETKAEIISKRAENAEIIISDFNNIDIDEKFDYVVLCNIFEYAKSFVDSNNPYVDYLKYLKNFLKEDGVILIALSNRLGLKYFAGFKEEHTNQFFAGINGYNDVDYVETFSKPELEQIIDSSGFDNYKFFYPYPNHEFPLVINTDKFVNKIPYERRPDYFYSRYDFFREDLLNQILAKDGLAAYFANSFLVEIRNSENKFPTDEIEFVKLNSNRIEEFRTITTIYSDGFVYKSPLSPKANNHIQKMHYESQFNFGKIICLPAELINNSIRYELLKEKSLEDYVLEAILNNDREKFFKLLEDYCHILFFDSKESDDYANNEFLEVFKIKSDIKFHCHERSNIDLIFSNIFLIYGEYVAIDYEWIFDFKIPLEYIFYRVLLHHTKSNKIFNEFITIEEIFDYFDLDSSNFDLFKKWDYNFMQSVFDHYPKHNRNVIPKDNIVESEYVIDYVNSYLNFDEGNESIFDLVRKDTILNQRRIINEKNNQNSNLRNQIRNRDKQINNLKNQIRNRDKQINNLKNTEIKNLNNKIDEFQYSTSWKITKPFRKIREIFKKV